MRDVHVMEIMSRMIENTSYSRLMCRYYILKQSLK